MSIYWIRKGAPSSAATKTSATKTYRDVGSQLRTRTKVYYARDVGMRSVVTLRESQSVAEARDFFFSTRFRYLPVLDSHDRLSGILSDRELLRVFCVNDAVDSGELRVGEVMDQHVLVAAPSAELGDLAKMMLEYKKEAIPLVDERYQLQGILTSSDILRVMIIPGPAESWA